jgi:hypothetical protein
MAFTEYAGAVPAKAFKEDSMKTWGNLKEEIISLGFEKDAAYDRYENIIITAVNRAMVMLCATVRPIKRRLQVEQEQTTEYNMLEKTDDFMSLFLPAKERGTDESVPSRSMMNGHVVIEGDGAFDIYYSAKPEKITGGTSDAYLLPLDADVAALLPLLASYFIWLDDDERKAVMYWNNYEDLKNQILALEHQNKPVTARIKTGSRNSIFDAFKITM